VTPAFAERYLAVEETQWWCKARREAVADLVRRTTPARTARMLEIGCSGGVLLRDLGAAGYRDLHGIDISEAAIAAARRRGFTRVSQMDATRLTFDDGSFDLVIASDVLEHIEDDISALKEWRRVLSSRGKLIVFVPAFQALWSSHDKANDHVRRYSGSQLRHALEEAGFNIERLSCWNMTLAVPGLLLSLLERILPGSPRDSDTGGLVQPVEPVNAALHQIIAVENKTLRYVNLPFGASVFAIASAT
jgi:ubiquinone/menaquinone biosynthesis C-methylase UbiE